MTISGTSDDTSYFSDSLTGLQIKLAMPKDNVLSKWSPYSSQTVGQCQTSTTQVTSPKTGISYSSDATVCPDKISPVLENSNRTFGVKWSGFQKSPHDYVGAAATELWHSPPGASPSGVLTVTQWYQ